MKFYQTFHFLFPIPFSIFLTIDDYTYPILSHKLSTIVSFFTRLSAPPLPPLVPVLLVVPDPFVVSVGTISSSKELRSSCSFFFNSCGGSCDKSRLASFADCVETKMCRRMLEDDVTSRRIFQIKIRRRNSFRTWNQNGFF